MNFAYRTFPFNHQVSGRRRLVLALNYIYTIIFTGSIVYSGVMTGRKRKVNGDPKVAQSSPTGALQILSEQAAALKAEKENEYKELTEMTLEDVDTLGGQTLADRYKNAVRYVRTRGWTQEKATQAVRIHRTTYKRYVHYT